MGLLLCDWFLVVPSENKNFALYSCFKIRCFLLYIGNFQIILIKICWHASVQMSSPKAHINFKTCRHNKQTFCLNTISKRARSENCHTWLLRTQLPHSFSFGKQIIKYCIFLIQQLLFNILSGIYKIYLKFFFYRISKIFWLQWVRLQSFVFVYFCIPCTCILFGVEHRQIDQRGA